MSAEFVLNLAAASDNLDLAKTMVRRGVDVNKGHMGNYPLHLAADQNSLRVAKFLIEQGANVSQEDYEGHTPLHVAIENENEAISFLLIFRGANVNARNAKYDTPLISACGIGASLRIVMLLVKNGADVNYKTSENKTPLYYALRKDRLDIMKFLVSKGARASLDLAGGTDLIHVASFQGNVEIFDYLLSIGAPIDARNDQGMTPLFVAAHSNSVKVCEFLLKKGANVNEADKKNNTPLHVAMYQGNYDIFELLIQHGANLYMSINGAMMSLLFIATKIGLRRAVEILLENGFDVNHLDHGLSAINCAFFEGDVNMIRLLCSYGSYLPGIFWPPMTFVGEIKPIMKTWELFFRIGKNHSRTEVERCINEGAMINAREHAVGNTHLHFVKSVEVAKLLLRNGAIYNLRNKRDETPESKSSNAEIKALLEKTDKIFKKVKSGDRSSIADLADLKDDEFIAITNSRDERGLNLIRLAKKHNCRRVIPELQRMVERRAS